MLHTISISTITVFILILLSLAGFSANDKNKQSKIFNPTIIFFTVWFVNLFLYDLDSYIGMLQFRMSDKADYLLAISFSLFYLGNLISRFCKKRAKVIDQKISILDVKWLWFVNIIMFFFFAVAAIWKCVIAYSMYGGFFSFFASIREDYHAGILVYPLFLNFMLLPGYFLILNLGILFGYRRSRFALLLGFFVLLLSFLNASAVGMRGSYFVFSLIFLISIAVSRFVLNERYNIKDYVELIFSFILMMIILSLPTYLRNLEWSRSLQVSQLKNVNMMLSERFHGDMDAHAHASIFYDALFRDNYIHLIGTVPAYSYFIDEPWPSYYSGEWTFRGFYSAANALSMLIWGAWIFPHINNKTFYAPVCIGPFNSSNYITYVYSDFGYLGLICISLLMGFISNYLYQKMLDSKSLIHIQSVSIIILSLILSIRGVITNGVYIWVLLLLMLLQVLFKKFVFRL